MISWARVWLLSVAVLLGPDAAEARAQAPPFTQPIDSGSLVRIRLVSGDQVLGRLVARFGPSTDRMVFCRYPGNPCLDSTAAGLRVQLRSGIAQVEVATGSRAAHGAVIGGLVGLGLGLLEGALISALCDSDNCPQPAALVVAGTVGGVAWGAIFGSTSIVWRPAP